MNKKYSDDQIAWLKENYHCAPWEEIFKIFPNDTQVNIRTKASYYGLKRDKSIVKAGRNKQHTKTDEELIKKYYPDSSWEQLYEIFPNRSYQSIKYLANKYGVKRSDNFIHNAQSNAKREYTDEDIEWLKNNYANSSWDEICAHFPDKSKEAIHGIAKRNHIQKIKKDIDPTDIVGKRFGKLVVKKYLGRKIVGKKKRIEHMYLCKCDCGNVKELQRHSLVSSGTGSCGCYKKEPHFSRRVGQFKKHASLKILSIKQGAKKRGLVYELDDLYATHLINSDCYYCGMQPLSETRDATYDEPTRFNGIDRINSNEGYVMGNVVPCCKWCNQAKSTMTQSDFYIWIQRISKNFTIDKITDISSKF